MSGRTAVGASPKPSHEDMIESIAKMPLRDFLFFIVRLEQVLRGKGVR